MESHPIELKVAPFDGIDLQKNQVNHVIGVYFTEQKFLFF